MELRPELRTWRFLLAAEGALAHAATAATAEDMDSRVGPQIKQAQASLGGALSTLEDQGAPGPHVPQATMVFQAYELDELVAVLTGAVQRVPARAQWLNERLSDLRDKFIAADTELRQRLGLPTE